MKFQEQAISTDGISTRFLNLSGMLLQHVSSLFSLAALEISQFLQQSLTSLLLFIALILSVFIGYLALLATGVALAVTQFHLTWPVTLGAVTLLHALIALFLVLMLRQQRSHKLLAMTCAEIQHDIDALSANTAPLPSQDL